MLKPNSYVVQLLENGSTISHNLIEDYAGWKQPKPGMKESNI